jgi:hypothetical protein
MSADSIPQPDRLPARIEAFFAKNPTEYLTYKDMCLKWGCTEQEARLAVAGIKKRGGLVQTQTVVTLRGPNE